MYIMLSSVVYKCIHVIPQEMLVGPETHEAGMGGGGGRRRPPHPSTHSPR